MANDKASPAQIGRPVRIVSISFVEKGLAICFDANLPRSGSARALARAYGLGELRDYIVRSRRGIDALRGWAFAGKTLSRMTRMAE